MAWYGYVIGAAIIIVFISSVISFVKSVIRLVQRRKHRTDSPEPEPDVNDQNENLKKGD